MAKDKKAKKAEKKVRVAQKQEKKAAQKEKKSVKKRNRDDDSDVDDADLDAILAEYARQQEQFVKVTETQCEPPSARASATIIGSPANDSELFIFGGEYFDGAMARFYNDLFIYNITRDEWKLVTSPNTPLPRSGHAWCRGGNTGVVYLFGGEFSSPKQGTFYHYNDFWQLDPATREWTRLETKRKGPPARSGHRMTYFKNYIILFGGFQDTSQQTKYMQDLWIYDCINFTWHEPKLPAASAKPDARSSFSLLPHATGAVLYGGYSRVKAGTGAGGGGKPGRGGSASKTLLKPMVHQDGWFLRFSPPAWDAPKNDLPIVRWERRKRPANAPNPPRAGATMCSHKGRGIQFGGVHDVEESEEGMESEFFNQLFAFNVDRNRYMRLDLRRPKPLPHRALAERGRRDRGKQLEHELLANLRALTVKYKEPSENVDEMDWEGITVHDEQEEQLERPAKPVRFEMPHPRFNAQLAVQTNILYIFSGVWEKGDREYTFDEMWAIDLGKLDGVKEIYKREFRDWRTSDEEASESGDEDEDDEMSDKGTISEEETAFAALGPTATKISEWSDDITSPKDQDATEELFSALSDALPHPRPFEPLKNFYARTTGQWQELVLEDLKAASAGGQTIKKVKKAAFERAEEKWWDCREEILALEDEQMEAGIGDIANLADKVDGVTIGRRR